MKVVFLGTESLGRAVLEGILDSGHSVVGVVTQPDRNVRRHGFSPVKSLALERNLALLQPQKVNTEEARSWIREKSPEVIVVAEYGQILRKKLLQLPPLGCFNVHASLLPKFRGASPIQYAIWKGETETGITIQKMVRKLDAGPILLQRAIPIEPRETSETLGGKLRLLAKQAIGEALTLLEKGGFRLIPQDEEAATYAPLLSREDGWIDWHRSAIEIDRQVRALVPWPGSWTYYLGGSEPLRVTIHQAQVVPELAEIASQFQPGEICLAKKRLVVATGEGALEILTLTPQARKQLRGVDFLNGWKVAVGQGFGKENVV